MRVFVGFDARERDAYLVACHTLRRHASIPLEIEMLALEPLRWKRFYNRPHEMRDGRLWDVISGAPMSTEFALTRFLVPHLCGYQGWALYVDCDFLFRADVKKLFARAASECAVQVVKHEHVPDEELKMDGQIQTSYARKNWSSCILWNCAHEAHAGTLERVNQWRGLSLHQFRWIQDDELGELPAAWNWLEGSPLPGAIEAATLEGRDWIGGHAPAAVHFTRGTPAMPGYESAAYADEWRAALHEATRAPAAAEAGHA